MRFTHAIQLISFIILFLLGQHIEAAGYCNTVTSEKVLLQSGDYVYIYWIDAPAYSGGGSISENCIMNNGASGSGVRTLQTTLNECHSEGLATDGKYGDKTKAAVRRVQKKYKIKQDGIFGPQTRATITWYGSSVNGGGSRCLKIGISA